MYDQLHCVACTVEDDLFVHVLSVTQLKTSLLCDNHPETVGFGKYVQINTRIVTRGN